MHEEVAFAISTLVRFKSVGEAEFSIGNEQGRTVRSPQNDVYVVVRVLAP